MFFFSSRRRHTRWLSDWSSDVCSSDLMIRRPPRSTLFPEAAAMRTQGERPEMPVDEGNDLLCEIVGVVADRGGVHVLVAAERGEAVGKDEDRRPHPALADEARGSLGHVVAEGFPVGVRQARAGEPGLIVEHREALHA